MKHLILLFVVLLFSCSATKVRPKKTMVDDLQKKNQLYSIKDNSYFYFMIDTANNKYLVKTSMLNSSKVIWVEKLNRK